MSGITYVWLAGCKLGELVCPDFVAERAKVEVEPIHAGAELEVVFPAGPGEGILEVEIVVTFVTKVGVGNVAKSLPIESHCRKSACESTGNLQADVGRTGRRVAEPGVAP